MEKGHTEENLLGEAIERILVESGLSISDFSRKVGYSRQYIYDLMKEKTPGSSRKIQLDTLKRICDATGYGLERLLSDIGYLPKLKTDLLPYSVIVVRKGGDKAAYTLNEAEASIIESLAKSLEKANH